MPGRSPALEDILRPGNVMSIADSPYDSHELFLPLWLGVLAGVVGVAPLMASAALLAPLSGLGPPDWLELFSLGVQGGAATGLLFSLITAGVLGALFSICVSRVPVRSLVFIGFVFGVDCW